MEKDKIAGRIVELLKNVYIIISVKKIWNKNSTKLAYNNLKLNCEVILMYMDN